jgi:hypothetical protein
MERYLNPAMRMQDSWHVCKMVGVRASKRDRTPLTLALCPYPGIFIPSARFGSRHHSGSLVGLTVVFHRFRSACKFIKVNDGLADARIVVAAQPHRHPREVLETQFCELTAGELVHVDDHFLFCGHRHRACDSTATMIAANLTSLSPSNPA